MATERGLRRDARGFTLVEVLVAMVILAVGLLGLQALGIGASRMVARAEKQSDLTVQASRRLEEGLDAVRSNPAIANGTISWITTRGDTIRRVISMDVSNPKLRTVRIEVRPNRSRPAQPDTFSIAADVFTP